MSGRLVIFYHLYGKKCDLLPADFMKLFSHLQVEPKYNESMMFNITLGENLSSIFNIFFLDDFLNYVCISNVLVIIASARH